MNNDNIIKVAQDLDGIKQYALSNELLDLFSKMSSVTSEEEYLSVQQEYVDFMKRIKKADSEIHDRLMKTAAFRWWDRLGDWFTGKWKGDQAREDRIRQRITDPNENSQQAYAKILNTVIQNGKMGEQIKALGESISKYSETVKAIEPEAINIARNAELIRTSIADVSDNFKGRKNRNDVDMSLMINSMMNPLLSSLQQVSQKVQNPSFNGNYTNTISTFPESLINTYKQIIAKGGMDLSGDGTAAAPTTEGQQQNADGTTGQPQNEAGLEVVNKNQDRSPYNDQTNQLPPYAELQDENGNPINIDQGNQNMNNVLSRVNNEASPEEKTEIGRLSTQLRDKSLEEQQRLIGNLQYSPNTKGIRPEFIKQILQQLLNEKKKQTQQQQQQVQTQKALPAVPAQPQIPAQVPQNQANVKKKMKK